MTEQPQPAQPKKKITPGKVLLLIVGGCIALAILVSIGKSLGYLGIVVGLLAVVGSIVLLVKKPKTPKKFGIVGIVAGVFFFFCGALGAGERIQKADAEKAAAQEVKTKADEKKAQFDGTVAKLTGLDNSAPAQQVIAACSEIMKLGEVPPPHAGRCGDAYFAEGQTAIAAKRYVEAVPMLESATKFSSKKDEAQNALVAAKVTAALEGANADLAKAEEARTAKNFDKAVEFAESSVKQVAAAQQVKADSPEVRALADKATTLAKQLKEEAARAGVTTALAAGEACLKTMNQAINKGDLDNVSEPSDCVEEKLATVKEGATSKPDLARLAALENGLKRASDAAIRKKRASRPYLNMGPDKLVYTLGTDPNGEEKFDTQWKDKWVRWPAKFQVKAVMMGYLFNAGTAVEMSCNSIDPDFDEEKFKGLKKWQAVTVEGRLAGIAAFQVALNKGRFKLNFDDCSFR